MIEGLKFKLTCQELQAHLTERSRHHQKRADEKEAELPQLKETLDRLIPPKQAATLAAMNKGTISQYGFDPSDPIEQLTQDIRNHRNSSLAFEFMANHLFPEDYTLDESSLRRLEILK